MGYADLNKLILVNLQSVQKEEIVDIYTMKKVKYKQNIKLLKQVLDNSFYKELVFEWLIKEDVQNNIINSDFNNKMVAN